MKMLPQVLELVKAGVVSQPQVPQPMAAVIPPIHLPPDLAANPIQTPVNTLEGQTKVTTESTNEGEH